MVSNYGRVKALSKVTEGKVQKWLPERIKSLTSSARKGIDGNVEHSALQVCLCKGRRKKTVCVARYVYLLFVKPFDINDGTLRVYYQDGNNLNPHYKNLILQNAVSSITGDR